MQKIKKHKKGLTPPQINVIIISSCGWLNPKIERRYYMLDKEKQDVVNFFRSNMRGYLALSDIQESVTSITYLFWNAKYNNKNSFYQCHDKNELNNFLMESCNENDLVWNIFSSLRGGLEDINLTNIFEYLNKFSEEKLIDIICQDYSVYSKYYSYYSIFFL